MALDGGAARPLEERGLADFVRRVWEQSQAAGRSPPVADRAERGRRRHLLDGDPAIQKLRQEMEECGASEQDDDRWQELAVQYSRRWQQVMSIG